MSKKKIDQKPSDTALFAALRRTIANQEYKNEKLGPDDLAVCFLPPHFRFFLKFKRIRENTRNKLNGLLPGLNEYMIARTAFFDGLFVDALNIKTPQIVLLGAGYDSRAYRFANSNQGTRIFELDATPTQNRKKKCIRKAQIDIPKHVTFIPINFNQESLKDTLEKAGYKNHQKTLFIWEGVSYYLDLESVETTLAFVSHASHHESAIAFDYTISISEENIDNYYGVKEFTQTMKEHHANEELIFSIDEDEIESFLEQRGLKIVNHLDNEEIERTFLLDENGSLIGQTTGHFRFVLASPNSRLLIIRENGERS
ncbi:class I SAM-dependent methyltransferase [Thermodesulfobacteriota bacterium]